MFTRLISVSIRLGMGILVILNGPANALSVLAISTQTLLHAPQDAQLRMANRKHRKSAVAGVPRMLKPNPRDRHFRQDRIRTIFGQLVL
jgi:hypothetical protein